MLILDPIQAYLGGGMDMNRANEARRKSDYGVMAKADYTHKTNYHIHLIFSERKLLDEPVEKIATRNMFYDENGKYVRTKKEILDEAGLLRKGCKIIHKGEVYERNLFTIKDSRFKSDSLSQSF